MTFSRPLINQSACVICLSHIVNGDIIQYADGTVIFFPDKKVKTIQKALNEDMEEIGEYCREN